jgi:hypothetical protein
LLTSVGYNFDPDFVGPVRFSLESRGNKLALLARSNVRDAILNAPESVWQALANAGFGRNTQNSYRMPSAHPEYNRFNIEALNDNIRTHLVMEQAA